MTLKPNMKVTNPSRRKMSVNWEESFEEIHEMNKKALRILAKRYGSGYCSYSKVQEAKWIRLLKCLLK